MEKYSYDSSDAYVDYFYNHETEETKSCKPFYDNDMDVMNYEDFIYNMDTIMDKMNPHCFNWFIKGFHMGWRKRDGYKTSEGQTASKLLSDILPNGDTTLSLEYDENNPTSFILNVSHHDGFDTYEILIDDENNIFNTESFVVTLNTTNEKFNIIVTSNESEDIITCKVICTHSNDPYVANRKFSFNSFVQFASQNPKKLWEMESYCFEDTVAEIKEHFEESALLTIQ